MSEINEHETEEQRRARAAALDQEIRDQRLMSFIDEKFEQMKEENEGLRRKVKKQEEKQFKFDKKAHEVQFLFNTELMELIESVQDGVEWGKTSKVKNLLEEMTTKIEYRNKLIKIADRSPYGWTTVSEYEKDRLAKDADDEKRIKDSEKGAEKIEKEKKAKEKIDKGKGANSRYHPYRDSRGSSTVTTKDLDNRSDGRSGSSSYSSSQGGSSPRFRNAPQSNYNRNSSYNSTQSYYQRRGGYGNRPCFGCGETDHVRKDCPHC